MKADELVLLFVKQHGRPTNNIWSKNLLYGISDPGLGNNFVKVMKKQMWFIDSSSDKARALLLHFCCAQNCLKVLGPASANPRSL